MKSLRAVFQTGLSIILVLATLLQSAPVLPAQSQALTTPDAASLALMKQWAGMLESVPTAPLAIVGQQQVEAQAARVEPPPVLVGTPLPPGTIAQPQNLAYVETSPVMGAAVEATGANHNPTHWIYLPLIMKTGTSAVDDAVELVDLRTRNAKVFQRSDGSGYAYVYMRPVHFRASDGNWHEYDNRLSLDEEGAFWYNQSGEFLVMFGKASDSFPRADVSQIAMLQHEASSLVNVSTRYAGVRFQPLDGASVEAQVDGETIVYPEIYPGVDLQYTIDNDLLKEDLLFHRPPTQMRFSFLVYADGKSLTLHEGGSISVACQEECFSIMPPYMQDAAGETSEDIRVELEHLQNGYYILTYEPAQIWMNNPEREFPVILDPTVTAGSGYSTYIQEGYPNVARCNVNAFVAIGNSPEYLSQKRTRGFFHLSLPGLPAGSVITSAHFRAFQFYFQYSNGYTANIYRSTSNWATPDTCGPNKNVWTWNNPPGIAWATLHSSSWIARGKDWREWNITGLTQEWYNGLPNQGFAVVASPESSRGSYFCSSAAYGSQCGVSDAQNYRPYAVINYLLPANPLINSGLNLSPSTQQTGSNVTASFNTNNSGDQSVNINLRVTSSGGDFSETGYFSLSAGGNYWYERSRSFAQVGSYHICAQMNTGSGWQNIPAAGSGVTCRTLNIVTPADVNLTSALEISPETLPYPGGTVRARFTVKNNGGIQTTERFRARVTSGGVTFDATGDIVLSPGQTYTYDTTKTFSIHGVYEVIAEHYVGGSWTPLIGNGSGFIRVMAPPPPLPAQNKGQSPTSGCAGEPVNTSTGNYFYDFTDLSDPAPGLPMAVTRWYNALDADQRMGAFGHGITWLYGMSVNWRADKTAEVIFEDGHIGYFVGTLDPNNPKDMSGVYQPQGKERGVLVRNANGTATLTQPDQTVYHFNNWGQLIRISNPYPAEINIIYNGGMVSQLVHSAGITYTINYTTVEWYDPFDPFFPFPFTNDYIASIQSSTGKTVTYTYAVGEWAEANLAQVTRPDGSTYTYEYDENHRLTAAYTPNGHAFVRNVYDGQGRVIRQYDQSGQESVFTYGAQITGPRVYTDALGNTLTHVYDSNYYLIREVDALGHTTIYTRDVAGNVLARREKDGSIWRYTYDARGNRLTETDPLNNTWLYTYDARNNLTSQTDPTGRSWAYEYDAQNRLVRATDPMGHHRAYGYDAKGNLIWERDEIGAETRYAYNELGLRTVITDSLGQVTRMAYDTLGNQTVYTDANGNVASFFYDALNRLERSIDPAGTVITFTYDAMGNLLTESNGLGQLRHYTYDVHDRIIVETDFNGNITRYGYDALGRRTVITDALGFTTVYTYNAVGNLVAERGKDGAVRQYEYDALGRQVREIDPLGRVTEYVYDAAGRQTEVRRPCFVCVGGVAISRTFYDTAGRIIEERDPRDAVTRYTHDAVGRVAIMTDAYGYTRTTTYDPAGRVIQETDPLGAITRYAYDLLGQVITITNALGYQTFNVYDAVGRVIQTTNERGYTTTYVYDANDRVVETWDALNNVFRYTYDAGGRLLSVTDALGRTTTYTYDANGNRLTETNPRGHTTTYVYDALNRVVEVIEPAGCCGLGMRFTTYDAAGRVTQETDALGYTRVVTYDVAGRRSAERSPLGYTTVYTYDVADNLVARQEPTGAVWHFEYDANGNQTRQTDPLGHVYSTEYDLLNRAVREVDALGAVTTRQYDGAGRVASQRDPRGATTRYTYDLLGRITQETDPLGYTRIITYDGAGNRIAEQDARGFVTTYVYDALNREIAQTDPLGHSRYTLYDAAGQTLAVVDYKGYATRYEYDAAGNQIRVTDALSHTTHTEYDARNLPVAVTDALSQTTRTGYDVLGRVVSQTTALGRTTVYTYNAEGWQTARRDALGGVWLTNYDAAGRPVRQTDPLGRETTVTYDALGRTVAQTDALGRVTALTYDPAGRLTAVTGPDGTTQRYTYDAVGNILTEQDGNGHITRCEYDLNGRLIRKTDPLGRKWHYRYDATGNLLETLLPSGHRIAQEYDSLGRLAATSHDGAQVLALAYDANGNRTVMTDTLGVTLYVYDALNRLIGSGDAAGSRVVLESYDAVGQRVSLTYPDGALATYAYDADGNLSAVIAPDGQMTTYAYDALGRPTRVTQGNGVVVETVYDAVGNTLSITQYDAAGTVFASHTYTVDAADRRTQVVEERLAEILTIDYTYDDLDRLIASLADDGRETHYSFDGAGNRAAMWGTRLVGGVTEAYTVTYTYNAANQLLRAVDSARGLTTYAYDADGNRSAERAPGRWSDYTYDAGGRIIEARVRLGQWGNLAYKDGVYQRYTYDGLGRRARVATLLASDDSLVTQRDYRYNDGTGGWDVLQTYDAQGESYGTYLYDRSMRRLAYWQGGDMGYLQNDGLGSVLGATAADGTAPAALMRYGDYGEELGPEEALPTADGYTGYERDTYTGLNYARHRYYDAATGTFLTVDPFPANRQDVGDLHRYLYVQANPINNIDPEGLFLKGLVSKVQSTVRSIVRRILPPPPPPQPPSPAPRPSPISAYQVAQRTISVAREIGKQITDCGRKVVASNPFSPPRVSAQTTPTVGNLELRIEENRLEDLKREKKRVEEQRDDTKNRAWVGLAEIGLAYVSYWVALASCAGSLATWPAIVICVGSVIGAVGGAGLGIYSIVSAAIDYNRYDDEVKRLDSEIKLQRRVIENLR